MCVFKSKREAIPFKGKLKFEDASHSKDKCTYSNQSALHRQCEVGADLSCFSGGDALYQGLH